MKKCILIITIFLLFENSSKAQSKSNIKIVGAMKNVMWKGQLFGTINLDTIANKQHLYGMGPVEYLTGELMIFDGKAYQSSVVTTNTMKVEENYEVKAPFFGYANIEKWAAQNLPDSIQTIPQLEIYLDRITRSAKRPFMFKLCGTVASANIHIVNLPKGSTVSSPDEAHQGQTNFEIKDQDVTILGFFSTQHKAIFTHHDTFLHMHLLTNDKSKMGHLDELKIGNKKIELFLAEQ